MLKMKRVFVAIKIELSPELHEVWSKLKMKLLDENVRWVPLDNLHITLRFLGAIPIDQVARVNFELQSFCKGNSHFSFELGNLSYFKRRGKPVVLFYDIANSEKLIEFEDHLMQSLEKIGFLPTNKFRPHLTLGRLKRLRDETAFYDVINLLKKSPMQTVEVKQVVFYESILKPEGSEYQIIHQYQLK